MSAPTATAADAAVIDQLRTAQGVAPRILALDLSLTATGVAKPAGMLDTIKPSSKGSLDYRIASLVDEILARVETGDPDLVVIEELVNNPRAANNVAALAMIHGALRNRFYHDRVRYTTVAPASLKKYATGKGNAKKPDMRMELYKRTGRDCDDDNQVDAAWLRLMALDAYGYAEVELPKLQRESLVKVFWPELDVKIDVTPIGTTERSFVDGAA